MRAWLSMGAAVLRFSGGTAIPGWRAIVPVAGALLVIAANAPPESVGPAVGRALWLLRRPAGSSRAAQE